MTHAIGAPGVLRQRLQLSLGVRAVLGEEIDGGVDHRAFMAVTQNGGVPLVVTVHRAPPEGPNPEAMQRRVDCLRELEHGVVEPPLAAGEVNGHAWVIEAFPTLPSVHDRLAAGPPPLAEAIPAIRDLARALAAMHRRGITHGAVDLHTVHINGSSVRLRGAGQTLGQSVRQDLDAVGDVAWALLSGERTHRSSRPLSAIRRGVAPSLDALCAAFQAPDPRDRPQSARAILDALDAVPTRRPNPLTSIVDAGHYDGRPRRAVAWLVVGAAILLMLTLLQTHL